MEQAVLGIFQEQLAKVIVGFRKEQVNANLLNGKGEIRDVSLNCSFLNEKIATVTPFIELEEIHVSRLGFHVTSWTNLRKAPIIVDIGHITAKVQEPLQVLPRHRRRKLEMVTEAELIQKMLEGFKPMRGSGSYGLVDRIVDNMTIEMDSFTLEYQTWGKFKTKRVGQWTPPALQVRFENLKVAMVDVDGNEASPDQVWQHNRNQRDHFMIYKKVYGECQVRLCPAYFENDAENVDNAKESAEQTSDSSQRNNSFIKLAETKMEIQTAVQRRLRDGAVLAVQMDVTLPRVDAQVDSKGVHELAHFAAGLQYCFAKDRSFEDPLRSKSEDLNSKNPTSPGPTIKMMSRADTIDDEEIKNATRDRADTTDSAADASSVGNDGSSVTSWQSDEDASISKDISSQKEAPRRGLFGSSTKYGSSRPVIILPNGLVVYRSISITCAIHDFSFRGFYPGARLADEDEDNGYIEFNAKGCVTELLWPKIDREPGLYAQLSTSFVTIQERFEGRKRTVLLGGMQRDDHLSLLLPSHKPLEIGADEFFPLFEQRGIREDPLDLRHLFPTQAFGVKTTVDIVKKKIVNDASSLGPYEYEIKYKVLHEVGLDEMDIVLDMGIFHRMIRFFLNLDSAGFDSRWHTGDWTELLTPEMLHHPSEVLDLDECLQEPKQIFLDENSMISSHLFNVTARLTNVEMKIPAAVQDNLRSCDIAMKWQETTLVVSSALPRTFLSGRIGNSISGDARHDPEKGKIEYPNDPSDICYALDTADSPVEDTAISIFRTQVTVRGFETTFIPIIPFCKAVEPRQLLSISNSTVIFSFEGEAPKDDSNQMKITLFVSVLVHDLTINLDLDLLTGAIFTVLHHKHTILVILDMISDLFPSSPKNTAERQSKTESFESGDSIGIRKNFKGRKILVERHLSQSRKTGGLAVVFCIQQHNLTVRFWRQNIPRKSPIRDLSLGGDVQPCFDDGGLIDLMNIVDLTMNEAEVGIEFDFHLNAGRRTVVKCCIDKASLEVCDLAEVVAGRDEKTSVRLFCLGEPALPGRLKLHGNGHQIAFRLEGQHSRDSQSWALACDVTTPSRIYLHAHSIKSVALLILEALLLPSWSKEEGSHTDMCPFPPGTVGSFFHDLVGHVGARKTPFSIDLATLDLEESSDAIVEKFLKAVSKRLLPSDLHVVLLRFELANILVSIPALQDTTSKSLSLLLHQADVITRFYPFGCDRSSDIQSTLACKGRNWSTLINNDDPGFYQRVDSLQSLLSFEEGGVANVETLVHPFGASLVYSGAALDVSMSQGIRIDDIRQIEVFRGMLKSTVLLSGQCMSELSYVIDHMKSRAIGKSKSDTVIESDGSDFLTIEITPIAVVRLRDSSAFLKRATDELTLYEEEVRVAIQRRDDELESMKLRMFLKERERFGAIALLSSNVAGWIRMGGLHRTGQRIAKKSLLWPYWMVLRKELLIIYPSPGVVKPIDMVSLVNATMKQLAGGRSRQDIKRGFAIVESSGMTRYFVARTSQEFTLWIREVRKTIRRCSDPEFITEMDNSHLDGSDSEIFEDAGDEKSSGVALRRPKLGNRIATSLQSARQKAKEFSEKRARASSNDSLEDFSADDDDHNGDRSDRASSFENELENGDNGAQSRRAAFGKKITGVGQATKSRFGSAIQSARQKGAEISNRRRRNDNEANDLLYENGNDFETTEGSTLDNDHNASSRRLQLGNKLGSAIQNAKAGGLSGIKGRIGGLAQNRRVGTSESNDSSELESTGKEPHSYWTCSACTFINSREGPCETCRNEQTPEISRTLPDETGAMSIASERLPVEETVEYDQVSFTQRTSSEQYNNNRNSRFGFRRRQDEAVADDSVFGEDSMVLKNVYVSKLSPGMEDTSPVSQIPLKRLQGQWLVAVKLSGSNEEQKPCQSTLLSTDKEGESFGNATPEMDVKKPKVNGLDEGLFDAHMQSSSSTIQPDRLVLKSIPKFVLEISQDSSSFGSREAKKEVSLGDLASLLTDVSDAVERALPQLIDNRCYEEAQKQEQHSITERMLLFGTILNGLLESDDRLEVRRYQSEVIGGFLNALLKCPLPVEALLSLSEALGIPSSTVDAPSLSHRKDVDVKRDPEPLSKDRPANIVTFLSACQTELLRFENDMAIATSKQRIGFIPSQNGHLSIPPEKRTEDPVRAIQSRVRFESILPPSLTRALHESIHDSLLHVMAERDEAHSQLIGANVMHIHLLERERKKNEKLAAEVKMREELAKIQAKQDLNQPNLANLFGGKPDDRMAKMRQEIDLKMEAFHQVYRSHASTDEEMTQLCTQLANEISTKTSHALEIERLKGLKETKESEKESFQEELKRMKELLASETKKREEAEKEVEKWKAISESNNIESPP